MTDAAAGNGNERLDRIEANLETVSETLVRVARVVENNLEENGQIFERLDQLFASVGELRQSQQVSIERFDGLTQSQQVLTERFDGLTQSQQVLTKRFDGLTQSQQKTQEAIEQLTELMAQFLQNAEADHAAIREMQAEVRGIQTENRRILDHLFGVEDEQQDNGI